MQHAPQQQSSPAPAPAPTPARAAVAGRRHAPASAPLRPARPRTRRISEHRRLIAAMVVLATWLGWMIPALGVLVTSPVADTDAALRLAALHADTLDAGRAGAPLAIVAPPPPGCGCDDDPAQRSSLAAALADEGIDVVATLPAPAPARARAGAGTHHPLLLFDGQRRLVFAGPVADGSCGGSLRLRARQLAQALDTPHRDLIQPACLCKD